MWVDSQNILPSSATSSYFSDWTGDKDTNIGKYQDDIGTNMYDTIISEDGVSISPSEYQDDPNVALIINLNSMVDAYNIQSLVLYNRKAQPPARMNWAIGLAIELYNRTDDPTLLTPVVSTNEIATAEDAYRYDFPAIYTYDNADFVEGNSITNIVNDTFGTLEVVSIPTSNSGNFTITGTLTINGETIEDMIIRLTT